MAASEEIYFERTTEKSLSDISRFIVLQTQNERATPQYLQWWFFRNPASFSFHHAIQDGKITGMAASNNFRILFDGTERIAAMPQKVLTDSNFRGQGLFSKLYFKTEEENLKVHNVDFFLTFTNEASTPIFLKKFGYKRGISPDVYLIIPRVSDLVSTDKYSVLKNFSSSSRLPFPVIKINNSFLKDELYFKWRYFSFEDSAIMITSPYENKSGAIFLKRVIKNRIPFYAILDLISDSEEKSLLLLRYALNFALRNFSAGLMALNHQRTESVIKGVTTWRVKNRFHFLVKGKSESETEMLSRAKFNFTFGDLDFI